MSGRAATTLVVAALVAGACGTGGGDVVAPPLVTTSSPSTEPAPSSPDQPVEVAQVDCPPTLMAVEHVACGVAVVPIDPAQPEAGTTRVTVATLTGYDPGFRTPLAVLQGGPGSPSHDLASWFPRQPFTQVFVDQRGTGFAGPDFDCDEYDAAIPRMLASNSREAGVLAQHAIDECARRLDDHPVLSETHSEAHAADVIGVMRALGYDRWVVYGVSYGSTIALEILRDEPAGLAGVVLDGVYPPELDADAGLAESAAVALAELATACSSDALCRQYVDAGPSGVDEGSVVEAVERVIGELDAAPMVVSLSAREAGLPSDVDVVLDGRRFAEFVFLVLYSESRLRYLPAVIGGIDDREEAAARWLAATGSRLWVSSALDNKEGTSFAVQCHDRLPFTEGPGDDLSPFAAAVASSPLIESCAAWDRRAAGPEVDDSVRGSIPTLLLSGRFDPITPPIFAERTAVNLDRSTVVEQDGRGHGIWYGDECIAGIVQRFVADPARELDISCAAVALPVEWAHP